ncbi:MAG: hypothetical protein IPP94_14150 [Ignavibacteria bacterium]|nr:hypothetical protein [Ignavibacteria bacterium]
MTHARIAYFIDALNRDNRDPRFLAGAPISEDVEYGWVWDDEGGACSLCAFHEFYFLKHGGVCAGAVNLLRRDVHVYMRPEFRGKGIFPRLFRNIVLPHLFLDGRGLQPITFEHPKVARHFEALGFEVEWNIAERRASTVSCAGARPGSVRTASAPDGRAPQRRVHPFAQGEGFPGGGRVSNTRFGRNAMNPPIKQEIWRSPMLNRSRVKSLLFLLLIVFPCAVHGQGNKKIVGYYPGWKWYDRSGLVKPSTIRYDRYTIINYAFLNPLADGRLACMDPWAEKNLLLGDIDWTLAPAGYETDNDLGNPAYHRRGTSLVAHAHAASVKVMISIGGWTQSSLFPGIAADAGKRAVFAHWCAEAMRRYDADGIDIDWEGPGYAPHNGSPADKANFTLLLRAIRDSLDAHGIRAGRAMLLSAAVGADAESMRNIEWAPVSALLDQSIS